MKKLLLLSSLLLSCSLITACSETTQKVSHSMYNTGESMQATAEDISIRHRIGLKIQNDPTFLNSHIAISSFNTTVLLVGQTPTPALRDKAETIAKKTRYVRRVYNYITISGPTSTLTRSSDTWVTTKVKTDIIAKSGIPSNKIKVNTENGTVYLMGIVTHSQGRLAAAVARRVSGVQRVVKLFEYK